MRLKQSDEIGAAARARRVARYVRIAFLVLAAVILAITLVRDQGVIGTWKLARTERQLRDEIATLRLENERLQGEVHKLRTSRDLIEKRAREMGLVYPGEVVIDTRGDNTLPAASGAKGGASAPAR